MHPVCGFSDYFDLSSDLDAIKEFKELKSRGYQALVVVITGIAGILLIYPGVVAFRALTHTFWEIQEKENGHVASTSQKVEDARKDQNLGEGEDLKKSKKKRVRLLFLTKITLTLKPLKRQLPQLLLQTHL